MPKPIPTSALRRPGGQRGILPPGWALTAPTLALFFRARAECCRVLRRQEIEDRFARHRNEGVEEDQRDDAPRNTISHATDHHPAIGMPDEHDSIELVMLDGAKHVGDMGIEIDTGATQMCA